MPETCYIKDEQGRFMGRKPGCKMKKAAAAVAEKKAAAAAEKKAVAEKEAAAAKAEKVREAEKTREDLGGMYDNIEKKGYNTMPDKYKKRTGVNTGDVSPEEAQKLNELAEKAKKTGGQSTKFDGFTTETTVQGMEHSIAGHGDFKDKLKIAKDMKAANRKVEPKQTIDETARGNVPLTRENFQKIQKYRQDAHAQGGVTFRPKGGWYKKEAIVYKVKVKETVKEGGKEKEVDRVVTMIYEVDPAVKKLTFNTMYKEPVK